MPEDRPTVAINAVTLHGASAGAQDGRALARRLGAALAEHPWPGPRRFGTLRLRPRSTSEADFALAIADALGGRDA